MNKFILDKKQLLVIGLLVISFFLVMDLNSRLNDLFRLSSQRDQLQQEVNQLQITQYALQTKIAYATSDVAVRDWARENAGMGQPGDIPVIPLPSTSRRSPICLWPTAPIK